MDRLDNIIQALNKVVDSATLEATQAPAKPKTVPTTPTKPSPAKPDNPILPKPGIQPKPKAKNKDVEMFLNKRKKKFDVDESTDIIKGGKADNKDDDDFDPDQLKKGIKVEKEHTDNPQLAKEIAKDHLSEFDKYYIALDKMESGLKKKTEVKESTSPTFYRDNLKTNDSQADILDTFAATLGFGPKFKMPETKTYSCGKCSKTNAYYKEIHPDTDMNEIVLYCPDCKSEITNECKVQKLNEMAFETGGREDVVNPDKKRWIESGDETFNEILPTLSEEEQTYLEKISSKAYQELVDKLKRYTGTDTPLNVPSVFGIMMKTLEKIKAAESKYKHFLEDIALDNILALSEFELVKDAYDSGNIKFDVKLASGDVSKAQFKDELPTNEDGEQEGLSEDEAINEELFDKLANLDVAKLQRRLANLMTQGHAVLANNLYHLMEEDLNRVSPELLKLYSIMAPAAQLGYFMLPFDIEKQMGKSGDSVGGSEEVIPEDGAYTIKCRGQVFPTLVHEIVKGIYEYLSLIEEHQGAMEKDTIEDEAKDIMVGSEIVRTIKSYVPTEKQNLIPLLHKMIIKLDRESVKEILKKSDEGKTIMADLIDEAELVYKKYKEEPKEEPEEEEWSEENEEDPDPEFDEQAWESEFENDDEK